MLSVFITPCTKPTDIRRRSVGHSRDGLEEGERVIRVSLREVPSAGVVDESAQVLRAPGRGTAQSSDAQVRGGDR